MRQTSARPDRADADDVDHDHPERGAVGAGADAVQHGHRPARVGEPVDRPPHTSADVPAEQAGRNDRDEQLECDRAETEPQGPVVRAERHQRGQSPRWVNGSTTAVTMWSTQEDERHQREVAVHRGAEKSRPAACSKRTRRKQSEDDHRTQQHEAHSARAARCVPEQLIRHRLVASDAAGSSIRKVAPPPGVSVTLILPPCAVTTAVAMLSPSPLPPWSRLRSRVRAMKPLEDPLALRRRHAGPVVDDVDVGVSVLRVQRNLDGAARRRVHERVADEVRDRLAQPKVVAGHHDRRRRCARSPRVPGRPRERHSRRR